jgi:hypothetical protein
MMFLCKLLIFLLAFHHHTILIYLLWWLYRRQLAAIAGTFGKNIDELPTGDANIEAVGKKVKEALAKAPTVPLAQAGSGAPGGPAVIPAKR